MKDSCLTNLKDVTMHITTKQSNFYLPMLILPNTDAVYVTDQFPYITPLQYAFCMSWGMSIEVTKSHCCVTYGRNKFSNWKMEKDEHYHHVV
jgi:hypothetical protein